jgi:hypothetical protein
VIDELTSGPILLDLAAAVGIVSTGLLGLFVIWTKVLRPFFHGVWEAVLAAPRIADDLGELKLLARGEVLDRIMTLTATEQAYGARLTNLEDEVRLLRLALAAKTNGAPAAS